MMALRHLGAPGAIGHTTDLNSFVTPSNSPFQGGEFCVEEREVHIQTHTFGQAVSQHLRRDLTDERTERFEVGIVAMVAKREGNGGYVFHTAFEGDTHRSAVMGIDGGVVAVIDAADDHIRPSGTDFGQGHLHTIDRCAVARPDFDTFALLPKI